MIKIGIGITTRNRPEVLELCLANLTNFLSNRYSYHIVICDDNSNIENNKKNLSFLNNYSNYNIKYYTFGTRQGIPKNKNNCLRFLKNNDYIFLFDDDCFPKKIGWDSLFINVSIAKKINHMMFLRPEGVIEKIREDNLIEEYNNCAGCLMFITKKTLDLIGGYDEEYKIYGFEHSNYSIRIHKIGLNGSYSTYITPKNVNDYIYSIDFDMKNNILPEIFLNFNKDNFKKKFKSCTQQENLQEYIDKNGQLHSKPPMHIYIQI